MDKDDKFSQESEGLSFIDAHAEILRKNIRDEKKKYEHRTRVVEKHNSSLLVRIDELEQENKTLKEQLAEALRIRSDAVRDDPLAKSQNEIPTFERNSPASFSPTTYKHPTHVPYEEWSELNRKYNLLAEQNQQHAIAQERLQKKCVQLKERTTEWKEYGKHLAEKIEQIEKPTRSNPGRSESRGPPAPASAMSPEVTGLTDRAQRPVPPALEKNQRTSPAHSRLEKKSPTPIDKSSHQNPHSVTAFNDASEEPRQQADPRSEITEPNPEPPNEPTCQALDHGNEKERDSSKIGPKEPQSSQTTQEEDYESNKAVKSGVRVQASDDRMPDIISGRTLKRKRYNAQGKADFAVFKDSTDASQSTSTPPVQIKEEPEESISVSQIMASYHPLGSALDLDETANQFETPRKRRQFRTLANSSKRGCHDKLAVPMLRQESSLSAPAELNRRLHRRVQRAGRDEVAVWAEAIPDSDSETMHMNSGDEENIGYAYVPVSNSREDRNTNPLVQVDANPRVPRPNPQFKPWPENGHVEKSRAAQAINMNSGSGYERASESEIVPEVRKESRRRLTGLLGNDAVPVSRTLAQPSTPAPSRAARVVRNSRKTPQSEPAQKKAPISTPQTASKMPQRTSKRLLERNPQPLRSKPLEKLGINDFKINPAVNDGVAFAYNQVIRNREARRCMPGCIREECCGPTFRAIVDSGVDPPLPQGLWETPPKGMTKDDNYLSAYLGPTYNKEAFQLKPVAEQQTLLEMAKMKAWANCSGRHKQAFQRERTPPGFWRTEFPATQEAQQDREEARMEERRLVEERWREAMTEGGRWLFRDE